MTNLIIVFPQGPGGSLSGYVLVGTVPCSTTRYGSTQIICAFSPATGVALPVVVTVNSVSSPVFDIGIMPPVVRAWLPESPATTGVVGLTILGDNFGTTTGGVNVTVCDRACQLSSCSNQQLVCALAAGVGACTVVVNVAGQSVSFVLSYAGPTVSGWVLATSGPSAGGTTLTVTGANFGPSPAVTIGGRSCGLLSISASQAQLQCLLPPGEGVNQALVVTAGGVQSSPVSSFSYDPPVVTHVSPATRLPLYAANASITVCGVNFGTPGANLTLLVTVPASFVHSGPAQQACNNTQLVRINATCLVCKALPNAAGAGVSVQVSVQPPWGTVAANAALPMIVVSAANALLSFAPPLVSSYCVFGQCYTTSPLQTPPSIMSLPMTNTNGTVLTLMGQNFQSRGSVTTNLTVLVGSFPCAALSYSLMPATAASFVLCTLPSGVGASTPICLYAAGNPSNLIPAGFATPAFAAGSLRSSGNPLVPAPSPLQGAPVSIVVPFIGIRYLTFDGFYLLAGSGPLTVTFGTAGDLQRFVCMTLLDWATKTNLTCLLPANAYGQNLFLQLVGYAAVSLDSFSIAPPSIVPQSLQLATAAPVVGGPTEIFGKQCIY